LDPGTLPGGHPAVFEGIVCEALAPGR
jgi:hypothetical protein